MLRYTMNFNKSCTENTIYFIRIKVAHTAELYTYFHKQPAAGNWCIMNLSHCKTTFLLFWAACNWGLIHYDFLTLQNYILTFLSSLLLGTDTLWDFALRRARKSCNCISWWTENWSSFLFLFTETCTKNIKWIYSFSSIYPPMSSKHYTQKLLHREIQKTKKYLLQK